MLIPNADRSVRAVGVVAIEEVQVGGGALLVGRAATAAPRAQLLTRRASIDTAAATVHGLAEEHFVASGGPCGLIGMAATAVGHEFSDEVFEDTISAAVALS